MSVNVIVVLTFVGYVLVATVLAPSIWILFSHVSHWVIFGTKCLHNEQIRFSDASTEGKIGLGISWPLGVAVLGTAILMAFAKCVVMSILFLGRIGMKLAGQ